MAINEPLLQALMAKNPDTSFALQESFPLRGTYGEAVPAVPLMELGPKGEGSALTAERAAETLGYWHSVADLLFRGGREAEARRLLMDFARQFPDRRKDLERVSASWNLIGPLDAGKP